MAFLLAKLTPRNVNHDNDRFSMFNKKRDIPFRGALMLEANIRLATDQDGAHLLKAVTDEQDYERALHDTRRPGAEIAESYLAHIKAKITQNQGAVSCKHSVQLGNKQSALQGWGARPRRPKKRGPDHRVPVMANAISVRLR